MTKRVRILVAPTCVSVMLSAVVPVFAKNDQETLDVQLAMEYLLSQSEKFRVALNLNDTNHFIPWTFEKLFYNQFNLVMGNPTNVSYKFDLVSILYNIAQFQPQLLKKIEELVYLLINRKIFSDPVSFKILPVILNIYRDDENYRQIMDALSNESLDYIDWLNSFIDYTGKF